MKNILLMLAMVFLAVGCQNTVNTVENTPPEMRPQTIDTHKFITDKFCRDRLAILAVNRAATPGGMEMIQVTIRSERYTALSQIWTWITGENPYYINYKVDWLDENGMRVESPSSSWMTEIFYPGETRYLQSVAPNSRCRDFRFNLREKSND